jgi:O-antigen/teichoic acid export membrane protein
MDEFKIFINQIGVYGLSRLIIIAISFFYLPLFTKLLGAEGYGIWTQIITLIALFQPFVQLGLGNSVVRFLTNKNRNELSVGMCSVLLPVIIIGLIFIFLQIEFSSLLAQYLLQDPSATFLIQLSAPLILFGALIDVSSNFYRVTGSFNIISIINLIQALLEIIFITGCLFFGYGIQGVLISIILVRSAIVMIILTDIILKVGISFPNFSWLRGYLIYGIPLIFVGLFELIIQSSDRFFIGYYLGASAVGIYSAAYSIACIPLFIAGILTYILYPKIYSLYENNNIEKVKVFLHYSWKFLLLFLIPASFGLSALSGSLLTLLTTPEFIQDGIYIIPVVSVSNILIALYGIYVGILTLRKKTYIFLIAGGISALINIILNIILIPRFGIVSAAFTTVIAYLILVFICYFESQFIQFNMSWLFLCKSIFASSIMVIPILYVSPNSLLSIIFCVIMGALVYFSILFILNGFSKQEIYFLKRFFNKKV